MPEWHFVDKDISVEMAEWAGKIFEVQNKIHFNYHLVVASSIVWCRAYNNALEVNGSYQTLRWLACRSSVRWSLLIELSGDLVDFLINRLTLITTTRNPVVQHTEEESMVTYINSKWSSFVTSSFCFLVTGSHRTMPIVLKSYYLCCTSLSQTWYDLAFWWDCQHSISEIIYKLYSNLVTVQILCWSGQVQQDKWIAC
jgi:hypothetical protein